MNNKNKSIMGDIKNKLVCSLVESVGGDGDVSDTDASDISLESILREKREMTEDDINIVSNILSEYFDSFVLFGYDFKGVGVRVSIANTLQQQAALAGLLQSSGFTSVNGGDVE